MKATILAVLLALALNAHGQDTVKAGKLLSKGSTTILVGSLLGLGITGASFIVDGKARTALLIAGVTIGVTVPLIGHGQINRAGKELQGL